MRWTSCEGVIRAIPHVLASWLALIAGFVVVKQTGVPGSILVVALFVSLPNLIQGISAFGSYRPVPELAWILTGMLEAVGVLFLLFLLF